MTNQEIVQHVSSWFGKEKSPGQVFDDLVAVRKAGVTWQDLATAIMEEGMVPVPPPRPSRTALVPKSPPKSAPKFAGAAPSDFRNPEFAGAAPSDFRNPAPSFGPYHGKPLLDIMKINPGWVAELAQTGEAFWANQARLAQIHAQAAAPAYKDTDSGGFLR